MTKACVIGAGIAGLVTTKTFLAKGWDVSVVEEGRYLGGVWSPERTYPGLTTQSPRDTYAYTDHPMPNHYPDWASAAQMFDYLASYAERFGVAERIRYETSVTGLCPDDGGRGWVVTTNGPGGEDREACDLVAVCTGVFNRPRVPAVDGAERFVAAGGIIRHSSQVTDPALFTGQDVVVVGFQKSAADLACVATGRAKSVTLVYRRAMWKTPHFIAGVLNIKHTLCRFSEKLFVPPDPTPRERLAYRLARPLIAGMWRLMEGVLRLQFRLGAAGVVPEHRIETQLSCALSMAQHGFYDHLRRGRIAGRRSTVAELGPGTVRLADGAVLPADVVVFGTGWEPTLPFVDDHVRKQVIDEDGYYCLYRNIVSPDLPGLGFVGFNSSVASQLTAEVGARWLAEWHEGNIDTPSSQEMRTHVHERLHWLKTHRPLQAEAFRNTCVTPFDYRYLDELLTDMGAPTAVATNRLRRLFRALRPGDYATLLGAIGSQTQRTGPSA